MQNLIRGWIVFCLLALSAVAGEKACVWRVEKGGRHLFIGGTCHCLSQKDYPLPKAYDRAYQLSPKLVFECDMDQLASPAFAGKMQRACLYPKGKTMKDVLSPTVYQAFERVCVSNGVPFSFYVTEGYKPPLPLLNLTMLQLMKLQILPGWGVDTHFHKRAKADGKPCGGLESVEHQLRLVSSLSDGVEDEFVRYSLEEFHQTDTQFLEIVEAWKIADTNRLDRLIHSQLGVEFTSIYQRLIVERNRDWIPEIERLLETPEVELILVGTGHLVGKESVLQLLKEKGCRIRFLEVDEKRRER